MSEVKKVLLATRDYVERRKVYEALPISKRREYVHLIVRRVCLLREDVYTSGLPLIRGRMNAMEEKAKQAGLSRQMIAGSRSVAKRIDLLLREE